MRTAENILWHAKFGLIIGILYAIGNSWPLITQGPGYYRERIGLPYLAVCALYVGGGVITFLMVAILEVYARSLVSYLVVGVLVALPPSTLFALALAKPEDSFGDMGFVAVVASVAFGTIGALLAWFD